MKSTRNLKTLIRMITVMFLLSVSFTSSGLSQLTGQLKVGTAKIDITPSQEMILSPESSSRNRGFVGVHDPIFVRAVVLDNGLVRAAILSFDLGGVPIWEELSKRVANELNTTPEYVMLAATHNHCAPRGRRDGAETDSKTAAFSALVEDQAINAVRQARTNLQPARVGFGRGKAYVNTNRDEMVGDQCKLGVNPDGPSDKSVDVIRFEALSGKPIAVFINYAVHAVVMMDAKTKDGGPEITGDLPGATSRYVENYYNNEVVALWTSGAAGDQRPVYRALDNRSIQERGRIDEGAAGYVLLDVQSRRLGEEVVRVSDAITRTASQTRIWGGLNVVTCPGGRTSWAEGPVGYKIEETGPVDIRLALLMINDIALSGVSGEVVSIIGQHFKEESPYNKSIMVTHVGSSTGYIPDDSQYPKLTYQVTRSRLQPGCSENAIINGLVDLMEIYQGTLQADNLK